MNESTHPSHPHPADDALRLAMQRLKAGREEVVLPAGLEDEVMNRIMKEAAPKPVPPVRRLLALRAACAAAAVAAVVLLSLWHADKPPAGSSRKPAVAKVSKPAPAGETPVGNTEGEPADGPGAPDAGIRSGVRTVTAPVRTAVPAPQEADELLASVPERAETSGSAFAAEDMDGLVRRMEQFERSVQTVPQEWRAVPASAVPAVDMHDTEPDDIEQRMRDFIRRNENQNNIIM